MCVYIIYLLCIVVFCSIHGERDWWRGKVEPRM
jgi:hypothetical protein